MADKIADFLSVLAPLILLMVSVLRLLLKYKVL
jgi:hypothetical protein